MPKKLIIFASGSKNGGGSGFENLVLATEDGRLNAKIIGVVSNHQNGGVREKADRLKIPFIYFAGPWTAEEYQRITAKADFVALSGWLKLVTGLDPRTTFNIHPGPLPRFGGPGMYGHHVHEAVMDAYAKGELTQSAVTIHFVTEQYDEGPEAFKAPVPIFYGDKVEDLAARVNKAEHLYQPIVTNLILEGKIHWDGKDPKSIVTIPLDDIDLA